MEATKASSATSTSLLCFVSSSFITSARIQSGRVSVCPKADIRKARSHPTIQQCKYRTRSAVCMKQEINGHSGDNSDSSDAAKPWALGMALVGALLSVLMASTLPSPAKAQNTESATREVVKLARWGENTTETQHNKSSATKPLHKPAAAHSHHPSSPSSGTSSGLKVPSSGTKPSGQKSTEPVPMHIKLLRFVKKVGPGVAAFMVISYLLNIAFQSFKRKQIEKFKKQLGGLGLGDLGALEQLLDASLSGKAGKMDAAEMTRKLLESSAMFGGAAAAGGGAGMMDAASREELAKRMKLNFAGANLGDFETDTSSLDLPNLLLPAGDSFEQTILDLIDDGTLQPEECKSRVFSAGEALGKSPDDTKKSFADFGSRLLSTLLDKAAANIESDDASSLMNLSVLSLLLKRMNTVAMGCFGVGKPSAIGLPDTPEQAAVMAQEAAAATPPATAASAPSSDPLDLLADDAPSAPEPSSSTDTAVPQTPEELAAAAKEAADKELTELGIPDLDFSYVGQGITSDTVKTELYKRYAVYCLSSEQRVMENMGSLLTIQKVLNIDPEVASTMNREIAQGMFQVAVSSALADGSLDEKSKQNLSELKDSLGGLLDPGTADSITDETSIMRIMYGLQKVLQDQGITPEDVKEMRRMAKEFGVDLDEMMKNSDAMSAQLGPEGKEFIDTMKQMLDADKKQ